MITATFIENRMNRSVYEILIAIGRLPALEASEASEANPPSRS